MAGRPVKKVPSIRPLREERGMTVTQLAAMAGITPGHLSQIERGVRGLSIPIISGIAAALGVQPSTLLAPTQQLATPRDALAVALIDAGMRDDIAKQVQQDLTTTTRRDLLRALLAIERNTGSAD